MKYILFLFFSLASISGFALETLTDSIHRVSTDDSSIAIIWPKTSWGENINTECATGTGVVALDTSTEAGKTTLSLVIAAFMANKRVRFSLYRNQCLSVGGFAAKVHRVDVYH